MSIINNMSISKQSPKSPMGKLFNINKFASKFYPKDLAESPLNHSIREFSRIKVPKIGAPYTLVYKQVA